MPGSSCQPEVTPASSTASTASSGERRGRGRDLTRGHIGRSLFLFSLPMLLGSMTHIAYIFVNAAWISHGLGMEAMAAVTVTFPVFFVFNAVANGLSLATNVLTAQTCGARDWARFAAVGRNSMTLMLGAAFLTMAIGVPAAGYFVALMDTPPESAELARDFLRLFLCTTPFMFLIFHFAAVLRGSGDSRTPLYFQAGSLLFTAILDPLLMFGWLGFPRLGLNGAAWSTIVAQAAAVAMLWGYLIRYGHPAAPSRPWLGLNGSLTRKTLQMGLPSMVQQFLVAMGILAVVGLVNRFGVSDSAAYGIAMRIDQVAFMPAIALSLATATMTGQNLGAGLRHRVTATYRWGLVVGSALTFPATALCLLFPEGLMRLFSGDASVVETGAGYLRIAAGGYLLVTVMFVGNGIVNGSGRTLATTLFTFVSFWMVRIPLAWWFSTRLGRVEGIWYAILISYGTGALISTLYYWSGMWQRPVGLAPESGH
ncbi:MAG TPA: MATE family efflux transporter [Candidatus Hydrogenedentes bacterium]|nr:MATE family efflux transporter [Candidatus Hydrogenedentota bacterium]